MGQRFTLVGLAVCAVLFATACGGGSKQGEVGSGVEGVEEQTDSPPVTASTLGDAESGDCSLVFADAMQPPHIDWIFPDLYPTAWVNYAEHVVVATVIQEMVDDDAISIWGDIDRKVVLRVDRILWSRSDESVLTGTFEMPAAGWHIFEGEEAIPTRDGGERPRFEVGCQYLMPLMWWSGQNSEGSWGPLSEAVYWVGPDGTLRGGFDGSKRLHRNSQQPIDQVAEDLARTPPSPYYEAVKDWSPEDRLSVIESAEYRADVEADEAIRQARRIFGQGTFTEPHLLYGITRDGRVGTQDLSYQKNFLYPYDDFSDWVTYAERVALVTVIGEAEGTEHHYGRIQNLPASLIERDVVLRIDETLWTSPDAPSIEPGSVELRETPGWVSVGSQRIPLVPSDGRRFEIGHRYVVPLVREVRPALAPNGNEVVIEDFWVLLHRNAVLEIADDGTLFTGPEGDTVLSASGSPRTFDNRQLWVDPDDRLLTVDQLTSALASAAPSPLYEAYKSLQPPARAQRIGDVEFRTTTQ